LRQHNKNTASLTPQPPRPAVNSGDLSRDEQTHNNNLPRPRSQPAVLISCCTLATLGRGFYLGGLCLNNYKNTLTASVNRKGVLDIDTFKGCPEGIKSCGKNGCYGLCYAAKTSTFYGYDFEAGSKRNISNTKQIKLFDIAGLYGSKAIYNKVKNHNLAWFRIGTMGDPSHDWGITLEVCEWLCKLKTPIIVSKFWNDIPGFMFESFKKCNVIFNISVSALDRQDQIKYRVLQYHRLKNFGIKSVLRIVTCKFGDTEKGRELSIIQNRLRAEGIYIDNPLRIPIKDPRVVSGDIIVEHVVDMTAKQYVSIDYKNVYIGHCSKCPDQCGMTMKGI
jgi:hypothetical protein